MLSKTKSIVWCVFAGLIVAGCNSASHEDFVPSENAGRQALETTLSAWKSGKPMQRLESENSPAVEPQDSDWKSGKKLAGYSIEKELPSTDGPKQFAVRLTFQGEAQPIDTVYFVVGRDPLWIFRNRNYKKTTGM